MGYNANDIETLNFREAIRKRIEMYMGSADNQGVLQCIREIISNCIDEATMGYGNDIYVELFPNNTIKISDEGRGCPFGARGDGTEALEAIFMTPHSGGKFSDKTYQSVIGMNGIGGKGVALSSEFFKVISIREGKKASLTLKNGIKEEFIIEDYEKNKHGTIIEFTPSQEVYRLEKIIVDFIDIEEMCKNWSYLNKGISFHVINHIDNKKVVYCAEKGIVDLIKEKADKVIHQTPIYYTLKEGNNEIEIALQWTRGREQEFIFTNGLHNSEGGTSLTGMRTAITRNLNKIFNKNFTGEMARTGLVYAVSCKTPNPSFANQTKTKINNPELRGLADRAFSEAIQIFKDKYPQELKQIQEFLSKEEKAEAAAERARQAILSNQKETQKELKKKVILAGKLVDCRSHGPESQLLIVEGK